MLSQQDLYLIWKIYEENLDGSEMVMRIWAFLLPFPMPPRHDVTIFLLRCATLSPDLTWNDWKHHMVAEILPWRHCRYMYRQWVAAAWGSIARFITANTARCQGIDHIWHHFHTFYIIPKLLSQNLGTARNFLALRFSKQAAAVCCLVRKVPAPYRPSS